MNEGNMKDRHNIHEMAMQDRKVVNLSDFPLNQHHISLLQKGLSFSPTSSMSEFEVFKDINLFLRKVIFRYWHSDHRDGNPIDEKNQGRKGSFRDTSIPAGRE